MRHTIPDHGLSLAARLRAPGSESTPQPSGLVGSAVRVLVLAPMLMLGAALAPAADVIPDPHSAAEATLPLWSGASACAFEESVASRCLVDQALNAVVMDAATRYASERGRALFGERFRIANRLSWSPGGAGLRGDIDAVFPVSFTATEASDAEHADTSALFVQWGVTRWSDDAGVRREDLRYGVARRFAVSETVGAGVVGVSALYQHSVEREHGRVVAGIDYGGAWGRGWLHRFMPVTGWRRGRLGFEERALAGTELGVRVEPTSTIALETALARWEDPDGSGWMTSGARVGVSWRPHPWVSFRAGWGEVGLGEETVSFGVRVSVPLGAGEGARWSGLGRVGGGSESAASDIWRPIESVGRLQFAERAVASAAPVPVESVSHSNGDGYAPADQAAFNARFVGRAFRFTIPGTTARRDFRFLSGNRFVATEPDGTRDTGRYFYDNTGRNTGTLTANRDDGGRCVTQLTFTSQTAGRATFRCDDGSGSANFRSLGSAPSDTAPRFSRTVPAQTATVGRAIRALTLPAATGGNGARRYTLTPRIPGLTFNARTRRLTGTPTRAGTYRMTYRVTDSDANNRPSDAHIRTFTLVVQARGDLAPYFTTTPAPRTYTVGRAIGRVTLPAARSGNGAKRYTLTPRIAGLTFNARTRRLTGTPTRAGTYRMTYRVTDADRNTRASDTDRRTFTLVVQARGDLAPHFTTTPAPRTYTVGRAIGRLTLPPARSGNGAKRYTLTPRIPGLTFNARTRRLTGTPSRAGTYRMTYRVTDADRNSRASDSDRRTFTLTVQARGDLAPYFTANIRSRTYTVGRSIPALTLPPARSGNGAKRYTLTPRIPGLTFNARTRRLTGTPTRAGTYRMTYRVTDADRNSRTSDSDRRTFTLTVRAAGGGGLAPASQAAFDARFVGRVLDAGDNDTWHFLPGNRFRFVATEDGATETGSYTYQGTASDAGTLVMRWDRGSVDPEIDPPSRCTLNMRFASATRGTFTITCDSSRPNNRTWRLVDAPAAGLAPAHQAAFDDRFVGKRWAITLRLSSEGSINLVWHFVSSGRFEEFEDGTARPDERGPYTYRNTGSNTGNIRFRNVHSDGLGPAYTWNVTFDSATAGTLRIVVDGESATGTWRVVGTS